MKEERYQSMYQQIHLSNRQKQDIWSGVEERAGKTASGRTMRLSLRGAVCVCAVLIASGFSVLAANSSYVERIAEALRYYSGTGREVTPEEKELYAAYGSEVAYTLETGAGTVRMEAVLYDAGSACIPFTLYPNIDLTPGMDLTQDVASKQILSDLLGRMGDDAEGEGAHCYFMVKGYRREDFSRFTQLNPIVQEDGSLTGSYLLHFAWTDQSFAQGDVLQYRKDVPLPDGEPWGRLLEEGESTEGLRIAELEINGEIVKYEILSPEDEVLVEIPLENAPVPQMEISVEGIALPYGLKADSITITQLAFYMHGTGSADEPSERITDHNHIMVVLKDGTVVERAATGCILYRGNVDENGEYEYSFGQPFNGVVDLNEVAGVRIMENGEEICFIPVE